MMDAADRALLEDTVRSALSAPDGDVDSVLTNLGWFEMLQAAPRDAMEIVFGALGATNHPASVLDDVVAAALGVEPRADLAVLLPAFGTWDAPGRTADGGVAANGLATGRIAVARDVVVACDSGIAVVPRAVVEAFAVTGIDPRGGFHRVAVPPQPVAVEARPADAWDIAVATGRRAVALQIAGTTRSMLALARTHAVQRVQFGRPIASFQAVRHRLAEALVAIEALDAVNAAAGDAPGPVTAALAKATAGRTARTVAAHCQQVLAGIGFTTEHAFHHFLKRSMLCEGLFGTTDDIVIDLGRYCIRERAVPTLIEL